MEPARMRVEPATISDLPAIRAAYADARLIQHDQGAILWPEFPDESIVAEIEAGRLFRVVGRRRIGTEPRLPAHYHRNEFALLEAPCGSEIR